MPDRRNADGSPPSPKVKRALPIIRLLASESRYCAGVALKNFIKILIGRKPYFDERRVVLWQSLLHLTGLRAIDKVTCRPPSCEGPGSQALAVMGAINFARCADLTYIHTPFSEIEHADRPMKEWAAAWETLFNLGNGEIACGTSSRDVASHCHEAPLLELCLKWDHRSDEIHQNFQRMLPDFRRKYYLNKTPRKNAIVTVAVHVRRGWDVNLPSGQYLRASAESILRTITLVKNVLDSHAIQHCINIYSEGSAADFAELSLPEVELSKFRVGHNSHGRTVDASELRLPNGESIADIDAITAIQEMVEADILITSKSSFSYCAALVSDGIRIFDPPLQPIDGCLLRSEDGSFDLAAFERQLPLVVQPRAAAERAEQLG